MISKNIKLIFLSFILFLVVGCLFLFVLLNRTKTNLPNSITPTPTLFLPLIKPNFNNKKIVIQETEMNNFYSIAKESNKQGDVLIVSNGNFDIMYFPRFNRFSISITESPFESVRQDAEAYFLEITGITGDQACKLKVDISSPRSANPELDGEIYPLSFCRS